MLPTLLAAAEVPLRGDTNVELVFGILLFLVTGVLVPFAILLVGSFLRPTVPHPEKGLPYECGEPVIGESWVQFDLRFYIVALFFIIFDVEIALLWPWAVVYKQFGAFGLGAMLFFLLPILVGFFYEWRFGYLDWVRADTAHRRESLATTTAPTGDATT
jgi:NADH-quinone oxidoreductase subunit A